MIKNLLEALRPSFSRAALAQGQVHNQQRPALMRHLFDGVLAADGQLIFSCEAADENGPDLVLQANGRYTHKRSHVEALCRAAGFADVGVEDTTLRTEGGTPVQGFVVTAHKPAAA